MILPGTTFINQEPLFLQVQVHFDRSYLAPFEFELPPLEEFCINLGNQPQAEYLGITLVQDYQSQILPKEIQTAHSINYWEVSVLRQQIEEDCESTFDFSQTIYFYSKEEAYGEFSNFAEFGIEINELFYPTVEHYYQSQKFEDATHQEKIRVAATPKEAAELGKSREIPLKEHWDDIKSEVMWQAVQAKFINHPSLTKMLLTTQDQLLIENSPYDEYWGIGSNGKGHNHLGTLLMRLRRQLAK